MWFFPSYVIIFINDFIRYFLDLFIPMRRPVMLVGGAGTGKTVLMQTKLKSLPEDYMVANVPFNFYTTSLMLQVTIAILYSK